MCGQAGVVSRSKGIREYGNMLEKGGIRTYSNGIGDKHIMFVTFTSQTELKNYHITESDLIKDF